ncbi:glycosyltransferase family 4 protein [Polaribacter aestuariivivens]|uniref:Glycosyltransferase family 4 protein n=1 Tax=Polaribacter aestuariivivens TaxID=2304626 RepID=A0A5S3N2S5_9FLAO|nr:glycosyltransferase family 4 protein [Polaribacter aestuariivivens]TMM29142.1 glycosyltransferase family 4 protein [Polaribacter aestuariivivens]
MENYFIVSILLVFLSFVYLKLAIKFKIIDKPNERSSHSKITVRGGGIVFPIAIILFSLFNNFQYPFFILGVLLISIVSFLDDIYTLSSKIRFPFQLIAVILILYQIGIPLNALYLISLFFGVGIINMFNFMDGINGITGMYCIASLLGFYFINTNESIVNNSLIIYALISLLIFGFFNFRKKALFFAGDIGSISIGLLIFYLGMYFTYYLSSPLIIGLIIVYGADATNTLLYRKLFTKESVLDPHRHHIYQKLVDVKKMSHLQVSIIYASIQLLVNIVVYKTYNLDMQTQYFTLSILVTIFTLLYIYLFKKIKA